MKLEDDLDALPASIVNQLDFVRVQEHVRATGWQLEPRLGQGKTAVYQRPESRFEQLSIPLKRDLADFALVMAKAVSILARFEKRPASEVLTELLFPPADVLKFAESSRSAASGDVPFEHAVNLLSGTRKTLLAAACSVIKPGMFHPRMSLTDAELFLQKCRLGQTERGSFVLTVACPLDIGPETTLFPGHFTRQVTTLLMRSVDSLTRHLERGDMDGLLQRSESEPVLSANLCEGLLDLAPTDDDSSLNVTANYSRSLPLGASERQVPVSVRLRYEIFPHIEQLARRLRPVVQAQSEFFVGFVETLNGRPNDQNRVEGQVVLRLITSESELRARAELNADDYETANKAHMKTLPISLEGVLRRVGRSHHVEQITRFKITEK